MMPTFAEHYEQLAQATGTTPGKVLEDELAELAARHPSAFAAKVRDVLDAWQAGRVQSPWPFLRSAMRRLDEHRPVVEAEGKEREAAIRLSETWVRNAGLYAPFSEVLGELYGRGGRLEPWDDDAQLYQRISDLWQAEQPRMERSEREKLERAQRWQQANGYEARMDADGAKRIHRIEPVAPIDVPSAQRPQSPANGHNQGTTNPQAQHADALDHDADAWPSRMAYEPALDSELEL